MFIDFHGTPMQQYIYIFLNNKSGIQHFKIHLRYEAKRSSKLEHWESVGPGRGAMPQETGWWLVLASAFQEVINYVYIYIITI